MSKEQIAATPTEEGINMADHARQTLAELREDEMNEQVEDLLFIIERLLDENESLRKAQDDLEGRLKQIERHIGLTNEAEITAMSPSFDRRDRKVLAALAEQNPDRVSVKRLQELYKRTTDIRQGETLSDRIRVLVNEGPFEKTDQPQVWLYVGE